MSDEKIAKFIEILRNKLRYDYIDELFKVDDGIIILIQDDHLDFNEGRYYSYNIIEKILNEDVSRETLINKEEN